MRTHKKPQAAGPSGGRRLIRRLLGVLLILFLGMNLVAALHAWRFTHFSKRGPDKQNAAGHLSVAEKLHVLLTGIDNPRPINVLTPGRPYTTLRIQSNKMLECWYIRINNSLTANSVTADSVRGTVILFHGYGGEKSSLIDKAEEFLNLGYNTLLVDFMGSGGSEGDQTTIGFKEAEEVRSCFEYIENNYGAKPIYLFGTSMGAVAILRAVQDGNIHPAGIILECPFGTLYQTVCARFKNMRIPSFPMAALLTAWGGVENGFSPFGFRPIDYAGAVDCPCLLLYGEKDDKVSRQEIDGIYDHLKGWKQLRTYPLAGHENYLVKYKSDWVRDVGDFLQRK